MWRIEFEKPIPVDLEEEEQIDRIYGCGYLAECNDAFARLLGSTSAEELTGARFGALVPRNNKQLFEELLSAIRSGYRTTIVETTPLDAQGRRRYRLRSQFGIVENGELKRIWGTTRDITDLKRAGLSVEAAERRFRAILERLPLPAVVVDPAGQVLFANDALLQLVGWLKEESTARSWFDLLADPASRDRWKAALVPAGSGRLFARLESPVLSAEGTPHRIAWDATLLVDADGAVEGIAAIGMGVSSHKAPDGRIGQAE